MIYPAVMVVPEHQLPAARRLADYCRSLDGTEVRVKVRTRAEDAAFSPAYPSNRFPNIQSQSFNLALDEMDGRPFIWLEADSIPLKPNWRTVLSHEFDTCGGEMLLPVLRSRFELGSGIGVYGSNARRLIPRQFQVNSWDWWVLDRIPSLVRTTRSIHHSYGIYDRRGVAAPHKFPRDLAVLDPGSWVFHKDADQGLIGHGKPLGTKTFWHSGDLGDIVAFLPVMRHLGGGALAVGSDPLGIIRPLEGARWEFFKPLLEVQPWVSEVDHRPPQAGDVDMNRWRVVYSPRKTLSESQAEYLGTGKIDLSPWLSVGYVEKKDRVVFTRSPRYHNPKFPWKEAHRRYGKKAVFMGDAGEHEAFCREIGSVDKVPVSDALQMARIIAESRLIVCNQSLPYWLAAGYGGTPIIQETHTAQLDSQVPRPNAQYFLPGKRIAWPEL